MAKKLKFKIGDWVEVKATANSQELPAYTNPRYHAYNRIWMSVPHNDSEWDGPWVGQVCGACVKYNGVVRVKIVYPEARVSLIQSSTEDEQPRMTFSRGEANTLIIVRLGMANTPKLCFERDLIRTDPMPNGLPYLRGFPWRQADKDSQSNMVKERMQRDSNGRFLGYREPVPWSRAANDPHDGTRRFRLNP